MSKPSAEEVDNPESVNQTQAQESDAQPSTTVDKTDENIATTVAANSPESKPLDDVGNQENFQQTQKPEEDTQPSTTIENEDVKAPTTAIDAANSIESKPLEEAGNQVDVEQTQTRDEDVQPSITTESKDANTPTTATVESNSTESKLLEEVGNQVDVEQTPTRDEDVQPSITTESKDANTPTTATVAANSTESKHSEEVGSLESVDPSQTQENDTQPPIDSIDATDDNTTTTPGAETPAANSTELKSSEGVSNLESVNEAQIQGNDSQPSTTTDNRDATAVNATTKTTVSANSAESKRSEDVGNQENIAQSLREVSDAETNLADNKDAEKDSGKEQVVIEDGNKSTGEERKAEEESSNDATTKNEKGTGEKNKVEKVASQELGNDDNKDSGDTGKPEAESEAVTKDIIDTVAKEIEDNLTNSNDQPTDDKTDKSSKTENKDQNSEKTTGENREAGEKATEINIEQQKDDSKHESADTAKNQTQDHPGTTNESKEQAGEVEAPETATKAEGVAPNDKTESDTSKENDKVKEVSSGEKVDGDITEATEDRESRKEETKTEKVEENDGAKNTDTAEMAETGPGEKLSSTEGSDIIENESNETQDVTVKGNYAGETMEEQTSVTKDQDNTNQVVEKKVGSQNPEDKTEDKVVVSKSTSDIEKLQKSQTENPAEELSEVKGNEMTFTATEKEPKESKTDETSASALETEDGTVEDNVDQTISGANEASEVKTTSDESVATAEIAGTQVKNEDAAETVTGSSDQAKRQDDDVSDILTKTATNEEEIPEGKSQSVESVSDTTDDKNSSSEQNKVAETANKEEEIGQDKAKEESKKTDVVELQKDTSESQTDKDTAIDNDRIDTSGGKDSTSAPETSLNIGDNKLCVEEITKPNEDVTTDKVETSEGKKAESKEKIESNNNKSTEDVVKSVDKNDDIETSAVTNDQTAETTATEQQDIPDKTAEHESQSGYVLETVETIDQNVHAEKSGESKAIAEGDDKKDTKKVDVSMTDSVRPAVGEDYVAESSPENSADESKFAESKDERVELEDRDTKGQASDGTTVESTNEGPAVSKDEDVDLETNEKLKDKNGGKETTKPNDDKHDITTTSEGKSDCIQETEKDVPEVQTTVESNDQNRAEPWNLDSEKTITTSEEENSAPLVAEGNELVLETGTTTEPKEETSDGTTIIESKDSDANDKTTAKTNESSTALAEHKEESSDTDPASKLKDKEGMCSFCT